MGERYWISGTQLGLIKSPQRDNVIKGIIDDQFIGNFPTDMDKEWLNKQLKKLIKKAEARTTPSKGWL